jgi:transcriptional regulator with XRE-family HTH domain
VGELGRKALGARLRALRKATGTTQEALAVTAGIGRVTLVRIENGGQSPKLATLTALARALGCPVQELVAGPEVS